MINSTNPLSPGLFKNVMEINMPVSDAIWPRLNAYLQTLPPGIAKQISGLQFDINNTNQTLASITRALNTAKNERNEALGNLIRYYMQADTLAPLINILEQENTPEANSVLFGTYLTQDSVIQAQQKLAQLPTGNNDETALVNLYNLFFNIKQQNKTIFEIDSLQEVQVRTIAGVCPVNPAATYAQAVLRLVFGETPAECPSNAKWAMSVVNSEITQTNTGYYLGNNIPNPFSNKTIIPYLLPNNTESGKLIIADLTGRVLKSFTINGSEAFIEINMDEYSNGTYLYSIQAGDTILQTKRMVITK